MKKDKEVKTHQNGGKQELQSYTDSRILLVTSEFLKKRCYVISSSLFQHEPCRVIYIRVLYHASTYIRVKIKTIHRQTSLATLVRLHSEEYKNAQDF